MDDDERKQRQICDERVRDGLAVLNRAGDLVDFVGSDQKMQKDFVLNVVRALLSTMDNMIAVQLALGIVHQNLTPEQRAHVLNAAVAEVFDLQDMNPDDLPPTGKPN